MVRVDASDQRRYEMDLGKKPRKGHRLTKALKYKTAAVSGRGRTNKQSSGKSAREAKTRAPSPKAPLASSTNAQQEDSGQLSRSALELQCILDRMSVGLPPAKPLKS